MWHAIVPLHMQMIEGCENKGTANPRLLTIHGETSSADKGALVCDLLMIGIFTWNQIRYGMNMLFFIVPLVLIGLWLASFALIPEIYHFTASALEITHKFRKAVKIPYEWVFNYEASVHDSFVNILHRNTVKIYYTEDGKKRMVLCRPRDAEAFVDALKANCPEFCVEGSDSKLQVFFDYRNKKAANRDDEQSR